jgi:hypothetical protein
VVVHAELLRVPGGDDVGQARASGPADSLVALADRFAA